MTSPLVLLDLDGTLMDSVPGIVSSATAAYRAVGVPVPDAGTLRSFVGPPITDSFRAHGIAPEAMELAVTAYRTAFAAGGMYDTRVFEGIAPMLESLRAAGLTLLVATSKPEVFARPICEQFGLSPLLDGVHGASLDESQSTKALVIEAALDGLGERYAGPARALMVGDREHDVAGARAHGIDTLGVTWGYAAPGELEEAGALEVLDTVDALTSAVLTRLAG